MSGVRTDRIIARYWATVPEQDRAAIEAAIPEGHSIVLTAGRKAQPGTADVRLRTPDRVVAEDRGRHLVELCWFVLRGVAA